MRTVEARARGSSLLEVLIAGTLLLIAFAIAGEILVESGRRLQRELRREGDLTVAVLERLRADIRMSQDAVVMEDPESPWPMLRLIGHPAGRVEWRRSLDRLVRRVTARSSAPVEAELLRGVRAFAPTVTELPGLFVVADLELRVVDELEASSGAAGLAVERDRTRNLRVAAALRLDPEDP